MRRQSLAVLCLLGMLAVGCARDEGAPVPAVQDCSQRNDYVLPTEPAGAQGVIEVRQQADDAAEVVVVGRIAGDKKPLIAGRAAFTIVDMSLEPCNPETPWVYCCTPREELAQAMVLVKFVDEHGQTRTQDARALLGVHEGQTVVVRGRASRDEQGQLRAIVADSLYVRP